MIPIPKVVNRSGRSVHSGFVSPTIVNSCERREFSSVDDKNS
jgi:hypothetical protein